MTYLSGAQYFGHYFGRYFGHYVGWMTSPEVYFLTAYIDREVPLTTYVDREIPLTAYIDQTSTMEVEL